MGLFKKYVRSRGQGVVNFAIALILNMMSSEEEKEHENGELCFEL